MKITYLELLGRKFPLCFSLAASERLIDEYGSLDEMQKKLGSDNMAEMIKAADSIISILMDAGYKYCKLAGIETPEPLGGRPADVIDVSDPTALAAIFSAISAGNAREVETADSKNTEAARGS